MNEQNMNAPANGRRNMRLALWLAPLAAYLAFSFWYTNTGGPLANEEIEGYLARFAAAGSDEQEMGRLRRFMEEDTGRQFIMLNNIDMADNPPDVEGANPGESAEQLMSRYMAHMYPALFRRACHPVYLGRAVFRSMDVVGIEGAESWDQAVLMRYRSRRDLMDIAANPAFQGKHDFKVAALTKTIAYPLENVLYLSDPRLLLALALVAACAIMDLLFARRCHRRARLYSRK